MKDTSFLFATIVVILFEWKKYKMSNQAEQNPNAKANLKPGNYIS